MVEPAPGFSSGKATDREGYASKRALWSWVTYDWGSNAFATVIQTFVFATFFTRTVAPDETSGQTWWSWAMAGAALAVAFTAPLMGAAADGSGRRKPWIGFATLLCVGSMLGLWWIEPDESFVIAALVLAAIGTLGSELALVPYNAMLADLVPRRRVGTWSGIGWASGYIGGLVCLVVVLTVFVMDWAPVRSWLGDDNAIHLRSAFVFCAAWYLVFSLPLFLFTPEHVPALEDDGKPKRGAWKRLGAGLRALPKRPNIMRFLIARLLYTDGMATLFQLGAVYAAGVFAMGEQKVLLFGIVITAAAGIGAFAFSWIDDRIGGKRTVLIALVMLTIGCSGALLAPSEGWLWASAVVVGIFVGPAQAGSRSLMARLAPADERGELFGLFAFSGKVMSFLGPASVGFLTWLTQSQRGGMAAILVFLIGGGLLLLTVREPGADEDGERAREA